LIHLKKVRAARPADLPQVIEIDGLITGLRKPAYWAGIQRRYGLSEKRFSLFNTSRWHSDYNSDIAGTSTVCQEAPLCHVVPVLRRRTFDTNEVDFALEDLRQYGSAAAPGFMRPEGVVVYHAASRTLFKKTLDKNDTHKGA